MPNEQVIASETQQVDPVKANWDALNTSVVEVSNVPSVQEAVSDTTVTEEKKPDAPAVQEKAPDVPAVEEKKPDAPAVDTAAPVEAPVLKLEVTDIKDAPTLYEKDSFQALAQDLGGPLFKVETDSFESFKKSFDENYVPKSKLDEAVTLSKENLLTDFKPEVAAAIKLKELGIPEEYIFNPTAQHDQLLSMSSEQLLRLKFENMPGYDADMVDAKMEELSSNPTQLETLAKIERAGLTTEKQQILNTQSQLVQQFTEQKQQADIKVKQEQDQRFIEALNKESTFLGLPISKEVKALIESKYKLKSYDNVLNNAQSKVKAILQHEFGHKFAEVAISKAKSEGKAEIASKLSDVPIKKDLGGGRVAVQVEANQNSNWDAFL